MRMHPRLGLILLLLAGAAPAGQPRVDGTITVDAVGPGGPSAVPSLTDVPIGAGQVTTIDLVDPDVLNTELIVRSSTRVFVERALPRGNGLAGTSGSWTLPAAGN